MHFAWTIQIVVQITMFHIIMHSNAIVRYSLVEILCKY